MRARSGAVTLAGMQNTWMQAPATYPAVSSARRPGCLDHLWYLGVDSLAVLILYGVGMVGLFAVITAAVDRLTGLKA